MWRYYQVLYNDKNEVFSKWLKEQNKPVIAGDISDPQVVAMLSQVVGSTLPGVCHVNHGIHWGVKNS